MGGVFPLLSRVAVAGRESIAATLGRLYAVETLGSTAGGLITGFVLLGFLGQQTTVLVAVAVNLVLAAGLFVAARFDIAPAEAQTGIERSTAGPAAIEAALLRRIALLGAFVCGLAILSLQVLWMRMFRVYFTNTSYTFALVSSLAIAGLFIGSAVFARRGRTLRDHPLAMIRVLVLMAVAVLVGLVILVRLPQMLMFPFQDLLTAPVSRILVLPLVAALLIVLPPAAISGFAFPLACRMYNTGRGAVGRDVGFVLMVNTIGSVLGPVTAGFLLLPLLGAAKAVLGITALLAGAAAVVVHRRGATGGAEYARNFLGAGAVLLLGVAVFAPVIKILPPSFSKFNREMLFYQESVEGTLSVGKDRGTTTESKYTFVNNSAVIGSTYDAVKVVKMVGHLPFLLGLDGKDVLVIGFGIGVTTSAIAAHDEVRSIQCVELVEGLKTAAIYYRDLNHDVMNDPRLHITAGDGRHYLQRTDKTFDLISCDPTHPILGSGNLYTREYFDLCKAHLNPGGMVSQYLPLHKLGTDEFLGIIATFESVFEYCTVWLGHYHAVLLGSTEPIQADFSQWATRTQQLGQDKHFYAEPYHLAANLMLNGPAIEKLVAERLTDGIGFSGRVINTDDHSYTEFFDPACLDPANLGKNLQFFMEVRTGVQAVFNNIPDPARMQRFVAGNQLLTESLYYKLNGDNRRSLQLLQQAIRVNPEDQEFPFLIRLYF